MDAVHVVDSVVQAVECGMANLTIAARLGMIQKHPQMVMKL